MAKAEEKGLVASTREGLVSFYRETVGELRKVVWPTREEATQLTSIVLVVIISTAITLGLADFLFSKLFEFLIQLNL